MTVKKAKAKAPAVEKAPAVKRKPPVLMPSGKYVNYPVNKVQDAYVLLWNLSPKPLERLSPAQVEAIYKQAGKLLKAAGWKMPKPDELLQAKIDATRERKKQAQKKKKK